MKKKLALFIIFISLFNSGYSIASDFSNVETEPMIQNTLSSKDQKIIDKYNNYLNHSNEEKFPTLMAEVLPELGKISDKNERENLQMDTYLLLNMYEEAYDLNEKHLIEKPNFIPWLVFKCQLLNLLNKGQAQRQECHANAAKQIKIELDKVDKKDSGYGQAQFTYFMEMYKAGHNEYKDKMQKIIANTQDVTIKTLLSKGYNNEVEDIYIPDSAGEKIR